MNDTLQIALIQTSLAWEDGSKNRAEIEKLITSVQGKAEVAVLPEMFATGFSMNTSSFAESMDGDSINWMMNTARNLRMILTGSLMIREGNEYFNRLLWMMPNGSSCFYDKRHLFGYAEEDAHYTPGKKRLVVSVNGWKLLLLVCYDLRFPVWSRQQSLDGQAEYDAIIYVANWPDKRKQAWRTLLQARAIENQSYVIGVNRVGEDGNGHRYAGESLVFDPLGECVLDAGESVGAHVVALHRSRIEEVRSKLPFLKDGDRFRIEEN